MASHIWPAVITLLNLALLVWVAWIVGHFRKKYQIKAPATSGNPMFERAYRIQLNTLENTVLFLPALWLAAQWGSWYVVAGAGSLWIVGRVIYVLAYLKDPASRSLGFGIAAAGVIALMVETAIGLVRALLI